MKIGNKVKVKQSETISQLFVGKTGTVVSLGKKRPTSRLSIGVQLDIIDDDILMFSSDELEVLNDKD